MWYVFASNDLEGIVKAEFYNKPVHPWNKYRWFRRLRKEERSLYLYWKKKPFCEKYVWVVLFLCTTGHYIGYVCTGDTLGMKYLAVVLPALFTLLCACFIVDMWHMEHNEYRWNPFKDWSGLKDD